MTSLAKSHWLTTTFLLFMMSTFTPGSATADERVGSVTNRPEQPCKPFVAYS
ncbi:MAG: hypothetical protein ACKVHE_29745 [Planctomycetales bacterium]